jgi:hypothetical protein
LCGARRSDKTAFFTTAALSAGALAGLSLLVLFALSPPGPIAGEHDLTIEAGFAYDDNPFEAPSSSYFDQFDEVIIDPEKRPGFYIPFTVDGDYRLPHERHQFVLDYRLRHHAYGSGNSNADETYFRVAPGYRLLTRRSGSRKDVYFFEPYARYKKEIFFDRDTGVDEVIGFEDASNRYTYLATGGGAGFSSQVSRRTEWEAAARYERLNYESVPSLSSLDHNRFQIGAGLELEIDKRLKLYLDYTYRVLDYDERPSRDHDGGITADRTPVEYSYHGVDVTLRYKLSKRWTLFFDLDYTSRIDAFAGYNDYGLLGGRVRALWTNGPSRVRVVTRYRARDYPRAFIFDKELNPGTGLDNPNKEYDIFDASVLFETPLQGSLSLFAEALLRRQGAADPRFDYHRLRIAAGVQWAFESPSR